MSEFDDLARSGARRIPPAQPPVNGWERLQRDLAAPQRSPRGLFHFGSGFVGGLAMGAVGMMLLWQSPPCTAESSETAALTQTTIVAPTDQVIAAPQEVENETVTVAEPSLPALAPPRQSVAATATYEPTEVSVFSPVVAQPIIDTVGIANAGTTSNTIRVVDPLPVRPTRRPTTPKRFKPFASLPPIQLAAQATPTPKWTFQRNDPQSQPAHRWEVGASAFVIGQQERLFGYGLTEAPNSFDDRGFTTSLNNRERTFYRDGSSNLYETRRPFAIRTAYLEVAHQFPKGLRLSAGILGIAEGDRGTWKPAEAFTELGAESEFTEVTTTSARSLYGSFALQYTVFRRRRFRLSPGISLLTDFGTGRADTRYLTVGGQVPTGSQTSYERSGSRFLLRPVPSLHFQYHLTRRLALAGDVMPGIGIGARYRFE